MHNLKKTWRNNRILFHAKKKWVIKLFKDMEETNAYYQCKTQSEKVTEYMIPTIRQTMETVKTSIVAKGWGDRGMK